MVVVLTGLEPHAEFATTEMLPLINPEGIVTLMDVVPCPLFRVTPAGTVQV